MKAKSSMVVTLAGITTCFRLAQLPKASSPMVRAFFVGISMLVRFLQKAMADLPMAFASLGILMLVMRPQL